jgi:hypothetical protein
VILQAQALNTQGNVFAYENREVFSEREADEFRRRFQVEHERRPEEVLVVSLCGAAAIKPDPA